MEEHEVLLGQTIGRKFVPQELLGEGGMGFIYKAIQHPVGRPVALKVLKDNYMGDQVIRDRFLREAEAIARLSHRNIVMLFDSGIDEGTGVLYMAMEFLNGRPLSDELRRPMPLERILKISTGIASALAEAHKNGIVHRDLKPENVFVVTDESGQEVPKVLDFGFARLQGAAKKLTQAGIAFGTPHYMAPEQAMGLEGITAGADVYALGVMMYEMVCGDVPYDGSNAMEIMNKQVNAPVPSVVARADIKVPQRLLRLIEACMQKEPEDRPADGAALFTELQTIRDELDMSSASVPVMGAVGANAGYGGDPSSNFNAAPPGGGVQFASSNQGMQPRQVMLLVGGAVAFLVLGIVIALIIVSAGG